MVTFKAQETGSFNNSIICGMWVLSFVMKLIRLNDIQSTNSYKNKKNFNVQSRQLKVDQP